MAIERRGGKLRVEVDVSGLAMLTNQLKELANDGDSVVLEVVTDVVTDTRSDAMARIAGGPKSGRVYRRRGVTHQASAPGQYPASDTGTLLGRVEFRLPQPGSMTGMVGTNLVYGRYLELGTSRMAARPWLHPSFARAVQGIERELKQRLEAKL